MRAFSTSIISWYLSALFSVSFSAASMEYSNLCGRGEADELTMVCGGDGVIMMMVVVMQCTERGGGGGGAGGGERGAAKEGTLEEEEEGGVVLMVSWRYGEGRYHC